MTLQRDVIILARYALAVEKEVVPPGLACLAETIARGYVAEPGCRNRGKYKTIRGRAVRLTLIEEYRVGNAATRMVLCRKYRLDYRQILKWAHMYGISIPAGKVGRPKGQITDRTRSILNSPPRLFRRENESGVTGEGEGMSAGELARFQLLVDGSEEEDT